MNTILTTLNSKYIHSALSIRYIKSYCNDISDIELMEFTINQNADYIVGELYKRDPDIIGFSTYIWNREETLRICEMIKIVKPNVKIILGGPEVSFDAEELLNKHWFIDFVIIGEGEIPFRNLLNTINDKGYNYPAIDGMAYRQGDKIINNPVGQLMKNLDDIPSPYEKIKDDLENKIVYYESSRGCPFNCQFCLSSTIKGVRYFSIDRVKKDLGRLIDAKVRQVKFVDRTFNANKEYAMDIMNFIMDRNPKDINFHFEVTAHLLDREMIDFIGKAKEGLFQFEIGVQSTNEKTIEAIGRTTDFNRLKQVCKEIKGFNNIHQHLDLIAGLPYEGYNSFKKSFNDVYSIKPEKIQLGFLKLLKGSGLRRDKDKYGIKFLDIPPYEVLETNDIEYDDMLKLKGIEDLVDKYYNEGFFNNTIEYLIKHRYATAFDFFENLLYYWESNRYNTVSHSRKRLYQILLHFCRQNDYDDLDIINEITKYDYIYNNNNTNIPNFIDRIDVGYLQKNKHRILKDNNLLNTHLIHYKNMPTKKIIKKVHIEAFKIDIMRLIDNNYIFNNDMNKHSYILFEHRNSLVNRCRTYDVTQFIAKE
ncbi:B12-binding domain-containing radical SAM protein [Schnuerera sp. xch1]|uniref:B12-binding domain-containing radical SAM protein n=1 Tax=Schnuerera sp. xch1 TaxID=2874283 RepID=UPI001CBB4CAB|nr:B12-binding domain-containing radical SAM protein [Schnuerera sp. xch1]MBZ2175953.1 B12-binding domain-containing radical SAM protein [Schnuerera sp. xch1]